MLIRDLMRLTGAHIVKKEPRKSKSAAAAAAAAKLAHSTAQKSSISTAAPSTAAPSTAAAASAPAAKANVDAEEAEDEAPAATAEQPGMRFTLFDIHEVDPVMRSLIDGVGLDSSPISLALAFCQ